MRMFLIVIVMTVAVASTAAATAARTKHNCNALRATRRLPSRMTVTKTGPSPLSNRDSITVHVRKYLTRKSSFGGVEGVVPSAGASGEADTPGQIVTLFHATSKELHIFTQRRQKKRAYWRVQPEEGRRRQARRIQRLEGDGEWQ